MQISQSRSRNYRSTSRTQRRQTRVSDGPRDLQRPPRNSRARNGPNLRRRDPHPRSRTSPVSRGFRPTREPGISEPGRRGARLCKPTLKGGRGDGHARARAGIHSYGDGRLDSGKRCGRSLCSRTRLRALRRGGGIVTRVRETPSVPSPRLLRRGSRRWWRRRGRSRPDEPSGPSRPAWPVCRSWLCRRRVRRA